MSTPLALFIIWILLNLLVWGTAAFFRIEYCEDDGYIWVSKRRAITQWVNIFLPVHAIVYEQTCDYINGEGLAILMYLLSIVLLPSTLFFGGVCGLIFAVAVHAWHLFCRAFARKN